jgi:CRISPR-associated protein Cmr1
MTRLNIKTKTPIFTGDVEGESEHLRETGIMGSLRWWYEALVRGLDGGTACDPTTDGKCPDKDGRLCDACNLFGATGQARKFSLRVDSAQRSTVPTNSIRISLGSGWFLPPGWYGKFSISSTGLRGNHQVEKILKVLLALQANCGGIGARNYLGYGVFNLFDENEQPVEVTDDELQLFFDFIERPRDNRRVIEDHLMEKLPNLQNMFFYKFTFDKAALDSAVESGTLLGLDQNTAPSGRIPTVDLVRQCHKKDFIPISANVRHCLRKIFRGRGRDNPLAELNDNDLKSFRHRTIGTTRGQKQGAKIAASHLYKSGDDWEMRLWGYIPTANYIDGVIYQNNSGVDAVKTFLNDTFQDEHFWSCCFGVNVTFAKVPVVKRWNGSMEYKEFVADLIQR